MFAVIRTGGKQYRVNANDLLDVEKLVGDAGDIVEFGDVLMVGEGETAELGSPSVAGAMVTAEIVEQFRTRKVISFKKRRRQNSKRTRGHRQMLTTVRISEILTGGAKPSKKAAAKAAPKKPVKAEEPAKAAKPAKAEKAAKPAKVETKPAKAEAKPAKAEAKPVKAEAKPVKAEAKPAKAETKPAKPKAEAKPSEAKPAAAKGGPVKDDVALIGDIGPALKKKLAGAGVTSLTQIAAMDAAKLEKLDEDLKLGGRTAREEWAEQAKELLAGNPPRAKADR